MTASFPHLHVEEKGEGRPLVLMHGFGGSARNFRPQARALQQRSRVICFDARGHARSDAPEGASAYSLEAMLNDVGRVVDRAGGKEVVLGGLSMGAALALRFALSHPERLSGLVLAAFPPGSSAGSWASRFAEAIETRGLDSAGAEFVWGGERFDAQAQKLIRQGFMEHPAQPLAHILREVLSQQPDVESLASRLADLDLPTLVIVGSEDAPSIEPSRSLAKHIAGARIEVVEGAGHVVNLERPDVFNRALSEFIDDLESK